MKFLQKLGKSLMLPVACLPLCGILMGLGYWLCPASMQGGDISGTLPFIGILSGIIGALSYNRFKDTDFPEWLAFFSRRRSTVIVSGVFSMLAAVLLFFIWPVLFGGLVALGKWIAGMGAFGAGIYAFLNRLLIPVGLHHALNNVFLFDTIGLGDITHFWAGHTSADVSWSLGMYMSGFFPCMMFGVPGAALALVRCADPKRKKYVMGIIGSAALCSFVCGITEPFEFAFMFCAPVLYAAYALLYGIFAYVTAISGFRAGFTFSAGITDLIFASSLPAAAKIWMIVPLGAAAFVAFYLVFRGAVTAFDLKTPGREAEDGPQGGIETEKTDSADGSAGSGRSTVAGFDVAAIIRGLGGKENISAVDCCATRLRMEVRDPGLIDENVLKGAGAKAVINMGKGSVQVVIGMKVQQVAEAIKKM
ncbi:MAG: PTS transporter subunit EIIC [Lachnospiraceae bacterium]|nr:PTS transporter subunit EIIC [Lachnospiraceae bacterium]